MKPMYERYADEKPTGVYSMGYCGYLFFEPKEDDKFTCDYVVCFEYPCSTAPNGVMRANYRRHKVYYRNNYADGRPYIRKGGSYIYLENVMRTNY